MRTTGKQLGGVTGKGFMPGRTGNPGGRPKGLAERIRRTCGRDGQKLVEAYVAIAFGSLVEIETFFGQKLEPSTRDRLAALDALADRGFGRPLTLSPDDPLERETEVIINLPMPPRALEGQRVVTGMFDKVIDVRPRNGNGNGHRADTPE